MSQPATGICSSAWAMRAAYLVYERFLRRHRLDDPAACFIVDARS